MRSNNKRKPPSKKVRSANRIPKYIWDRWNLYFSTQELIEGSLESAEELQRQADLEADQALEMSIHYPEGGENAIYNY